MNKYLFAQLGAMVFMVNILYGQSPYFSIRHDFIDSWEIGSTILNTHGGYLCASSNGDSLGFTQIGLTAWDYSGQLLYQKSYGKLQLNFYPGLPGSFTENKGGGYSLLGSWEDTTGFYACLVKFNAMGDTLWTQKYGNGNFRIIGSQAKQTADGGFILIGQSEEFDKDGDFWLAKTDSLGAIEWEKTYGRGPYDFGVGVDIHDDLGYILTGYSRSYGPLVPGVGSNIWAIKVDHLGNINWDKILGGPYGDCIWNVQTTSDFGFIIAGCLGDSLLSFPDDYLSKPLLVKLDYHGNVQWERTYGYGKSRLGNTFFMVREIPSGGYIACGQMYESNTSSKLSGVTLKVGVNGDSLWMRTQKLLLGPQSDNILYDINMSPMGGLIATGYVAALPPDPKSSPNTPWRQDLWILKLDSLGCAYPGCDWATAVETSLEKEIFQLKNYPNPFSSETTISFNSPLDGELSLVDLKGRILKTISIKAEENQIYLQGDHLVAGTYFYQLRLKDGRSKTKMMIHQ